MNLGQIQTRIQLDPLISSATVITTANLNLLINEGALDLNQRGKAFILRNTFNAVASQQEYVFSGVSPVIPNFMELMLMSEGFSPLTYQQDSSTIRTMPNDFKLVSQQWLDMNRPGWENDAANDTVQFVYLSVDGSGNLVFGQYPKPATAVPVWKVWYLGRGTDMAGAGDFPWTGSGGANLVHLEPYHIGIVHYVLWQAHLAIFKNPISAAEALERYEDIVARMRDTQMNFLRAEIEGSIGDSRVIAAQQIGGL